MPFAGPIMEAFGQPGEVTTPGDVADVVFTAATDASDQLRFPQDPMPWHWRNRPEVLASDVGGRGVAALASAAWALSNRWRS